ncbi:MAG: molybdenum cofactor guanylyltransferase [Candidatus Binatia bacterium]
MKESASHLSAVVLAGGKSSRFGRDKAEMEFSGQRVLDGLMEILGEFPFQKLAVVSARGQERDWPEPILALQDDQEDLGPMGGIVTALRHLPGGILVTACDMPLVSGALIEWLLGHYDAHVEAVIPRHQGGIEPLLGIYEKSFLSPLEEAIQAGRYALHFILEEANVRFVDVPESFPAEFANVNTPQDYKRIQEVMAKKT